MRAPPRYSGTDGPVTRAIVQLASGVWRPFPCAIPASALLASAMVAAGACRSMSVSSRALSAWAMAPEDEVCA